ncbi:hypothetical protein TWF696_007493 [Orbilia brochopaga]|uniref:NAD(P)-binding domain-containing protein n=1 Tax=Orbilia brochopaga TaxID=3140254 RepID=A0AAV9UNP9_9PEZI
MKIILTGVTGYLGPEVLLQCVANERITSIVTLARRDLAPEFQNEGKITAIKVDEFGEYSDDVLEKMEGAGGCIWMMGTTPSKAVGVPMETLHKINVDWPSKSAKIFSEKLSPPDGAKFRFIYTSGFMVPGPEVLDKKMWFAEDTRKSRSWTEKYILEVEKDGRLEAVFAKPALITNGEPFLGRLSGGRWSVSIQAITAAFIDVILNGSDKQTLWNADLRERGAIAIKKFAT